MIGHGKYPQIVVCFTQEGDNIHDYSVRNVYRANAVTLQFGASVTPQKGVHRLCFMSKIMASDRSLRQFQPQLRKNPVPGRQPGLNVLHQQVFG
ncbi:hypothetical protein DXV75_15960 [Alteromonas aestuariivivens]|uniref:Uncharacterized protein n=1 Tax=Alteromonas aestuariivivens TaxID=1938339 RepID=A0A3D8M2Z5_9ALTE|nr:hypothetical protein DXV75_15960 [Alteromonas aestuariivivens]